MVKKVQRTKVHRKSNCRWKLACNDVCSGLIDLKPMSCSRATMYGANFPLSMSQHVYNINQKHATEGIPFKWISNSKQSTVQSLAPPVPSFAGTGCNTKLVYIVHGMCGFCPSKGPLLLQISTVATHCSGFIWQQTLDVTLVQWHSSSCKGMLLLTLNSPHWS